MTDSNHAQLVKDLTSRWPENRVAPNLNRISALMDVLGKPQHAMPVIQVAGTNGKGSTCAIIDSLLRAAGLRVGRFASPHLTDVTERILIDGQPISSERFDAVWEEIAPFVDMVDKQAIDGIEMTFFEVITGMAYAAFADAPVDVAVVEVGLGGRWDATSVADPRVSVVCPIALDHTHILGADLASVAAEKAGIIKPGSIAVLAGQDPQAAQVLLQRALQVGAEVKAEGPDFGVLDRKLAVGGQLLRLETQGGPLGDLFLPLFGEHMARNAALAVAAAESLVGQLSPEVIEQGLGEVKAPARLELVRSAPSVVLDSAHNPHGAQALVLGLTESFDFEPTIAVVAMMRDKDSAGVLSILAEAVDHVVITQASGSPRALPVAELVQLAEEIWPAGRVHSALGVPEALTTAISLADDFGPKAGILITGSIVAVGEARSLLSAESDQI